MTSRCSSNFVPRSFRSIKKSEDAGFSLIEVLISIIILSFGLLGMVGLQAASLQATRDARLQSVATTLARELAEMMRGNKAIALLAVNNPYTGQFPKTSGNPWEPATPSFCLNVDSSVTPALVCNNTTDVANSEMTEWLARVNSELPGARVEICMDPNPFTAGTGLPQWSTCAAATGLVMVKIGWTRNSTDRSAVGDLAIDRATRPSVVFPVTAGSA